jgi:hypothetical protein
MVPDTGTFPRQRIEDLRAGIDPIYPPVLLLARLSNDTTPPSRYWTVLLIETVGNRRDGVGVLDGAGIGLCIKDANESGFTGTFEPWGIVVDDRGHYCAERVSRP